VIKVPIYFLNLIALTAESLPNVAASLELLNIESPRLLGAFGPDGSVSLLPCFGCRQVYGQEKIDEGMNGSVFFDKGLGRRRCGIPVRPEVFEGPVIAGRISGVWRI